MIGHARALLSLEEIREVSRAFGLRRRGPVGGIQPIRHSTSRLSRHLKIARPKPIEKQSITVPKARAAQ
jgi:hypothetical protein